MQRKIWVLAPLLATLATLDAVAAQPDPRDARPSEARPSEARPSDEAEPAHDPEAHGEPGSADGSGADSTPPQVSVAASMSAEEPQAGTVAASQVGGGTERGAALVQGAGAEDGPTANAEERPWDSKPEIDIGGVVHALYELNDRDKEPNQAFSVKRARLGVDFSQGELLDGQLELELSAGLDDDSDLLRDAYVRVSPIRALRLRLGQFKKPYSALELWGPRTNPIIRRGASNDWITETLGYGGRDIGAQVEGRVVDSPRVDYAVGVFNGTGANAKEDGDSKDVVARVETRPLKWLEISGGGSMKTFDDGGGIGLPARGVMVEVDAKAETKRLSLLIEGAYGQNYLSIDKAKSWSALVLAAYKIPLSEVWKLKLEPVAMAEALKVEDHVRDSHILSGAAGVNLHIGKLFRLMVQGEAVRPMQNTLDLWTDSNRVLVQAALNLR